MLCRLALLTAVCLVSVAAGCRMCCSNYDYCGPVYDEGGNGFLYRKNSILGGDQYGGAYSGEYTEETIVPDEQPLEPIPETPIPMPQARRRVPTPARYAPAS